MVSHTRRRVESYYPYIASKLVFFQIQEVYIYGTGEHAQKLVPILNDAGILVSGLIDDGFGESHSYQFSYQIFRSEEIMYTPKVIIIASYAYQDVIFDRLNAMKMPSTKIIKLFDDNEWLKIDCEKGSPGISKTCLFIGDNTDMINYGCRATSTALSEIVSYTMVIKDRIFRTELLCLFENNSLIADVRRYIAEFKQNCQENLQCLIQRIDQVDAVVLNGEGSFIFQDPPRLDLHNYILILSICVELGKPFYVLNTMISNFANEQMNEILFQQCLPILEEARLVTVRDQHSYRLLTQHSKKIAAQYVPDACFKWYKLYEMKSHQTQFALHETDLRLSAKIKPEVENEKQFILLGGNSFAAHYPEIASEKYTALACRLQILAFELNLNLFLIECCSGDRFLEKVSVQTGIPILPVETNVFFAGLVLSSAICFISGRYHPSILASLGGTPCVFMGSNSHKTTSLQEVLDIPQEDRRTFSALPDADEVEEILFFAESILCSNLYHEKRKQIKKSCMKNMQAVNSFMGRLSVEE